MDELLIFDLDNTLLAGDSRFFELLVLALQRLDRLSIGPEDISQGRATSASRVRSCTAVTACRGGASDSPAQ